MSEIPEAFQVAKQLTLRAIEELTEENVRLRLKNGRLREALKERLCECKFGTDDIVIVCGRCAALAGKEGEK